MAQSKISKIQYYVSVYTLSVMEGFVIILCLLCAFSSWLSTGGNNS